MGILKGKTAIVTGGGTGIGLAIARRFCEEGAAVVICGRREDRLQAAAAGMTDGLGRVCAVRADVTVEEDIRRLIATAEEKTGRLDIVVNNAGVMRWGNSMRSIPPNGSCSSRPMSGDRGGSWLRRFPPCAGRAEGRSLTSLPLRESRPSPPRDSTACPRRPSRPSPRSWRWRRRLIRSGLT